MSRCWVKDVSDMHWQFKVGKAVENMDPDMFREFIKLRIVQLQEELDEFKQAVEAKDSDNMVDALIDLSVFAIGTLDVARVDSFTAWDRVLNANMVKTVGVKEGRPNPFGLPDLIKPEGWTAPSHADNVGRFSEI